ncbi:MAG TPA: hypothetical protein DD413_00185 [Ruminococcus sp.]|nr:hypothetical protein [Ruminococcus sp.]
MSVKNRPTVLRQWDVFYFFGNCPETSGHKSAFSYGAVCSDECSPPAAFFRKPLFVLEHIVNYGIIN